MRLEQMREVIGLQDHVTELGVTQTLLAAFKAIGHAVARDHLIHAEMFSNIAQHFYIAHLQQPLGVVHNHGRVGPGEIQQFLKNLALSRNVFLHLRWIKQLSLATFSAWITD